MKNFFILAGVAVVVFVGLTLSGVFTSTGEYAYTCGDGTEFSMTPADSGESITLYPGKNTDRLKVTTLTRVESEFGARFESKEESLVFHGQGERVQLIGKSFSTTCTPVPSDTEAPFNWGD